MNNLINILKKELKEMFRDKKTLMMMLIIPIMIPVLIIGMSALFDSEVNKKIDYYNKIGFAYEMSETEKSIAKELDIKVIEKDEKKLKSDYKEGKIDLYVTKKENKFILNGENNEATSYATVLVKSYFDTYKTYLQNEYLQNKSVNPNDVINIIEVEENLEEKENFYANYIVNYAFMFIIMAITVSATYPATDTTAGERERGTLETLLTFPIKSKDIILGKFLSVSTSSIITGLLSLLLTIISLLSVNDKFEIYKDINLMLKPSMIIYIVLVIIAFSLLISGLCIAIASKCKSFKEAQSALTPISFIAFFPGMIAYMANIENTTILSLIPFLNYSLIFDDFTKGNISYLNVILMLLSTFIIIFIVLKIIIKQYKSEKVLFSN